MKRIFLFAAIAVAITGCATTDTGGTASPVTGDTPAQAIPASASGGGLFERAGVTLSPVDRGYALQAEQYALASAPAGESVTWQGREAEGSVTAASPYQVGDQNCRQYSQRIVVQGKEYLARGAACRGADGLWRLLN